MVLAQRSRVRFASGAVVLALFLGGCSTSDPVIPAEVVELVAAEGRMRTYDVAWQNTRMLNSSVAQQDFTTLVDQAIILTARLHRLETARASNLSDRGTAATMERLTADIHGRTTQENFQQLATSAEALQVAFDEGDFARAKSHALEVLVIGVWWEDTFS